MSFGYVLHAKSEETREPTCCSRTSRKAEQLQRNARVLISSHVKRNLILCSKVAIVCLERVIPTLKAYM